MALTPAEKQKAYRQRKKEAERALPDATDRIIASDFGEFLDSEGKMQCADGKWLANPAAIVEYIDVTLGDIGIHLDWRDVEKAEAAVEGLAIAASCIAELLNAFKLHEINAAIERLKGSDLSDPEAREAAFREVRKLDAIKRGLAKKTRHDFAATSVKGEVRDD
jgi:hypothetical protein